MDVQHRQELHPCIACHEGEIFVKLKKVIDCPPNKRSWPPQVSTPIHDALNYQQSILYHTLQKLGQVGLDFLRSIMNMRLRFGSDKSTMKIPDLMHSLLSLANRIDCANGFLAVLEQQMQQAA